MPKKEIFSSEYTRVEILKLIKEKGGPERLDLSGKVLSGIDLSKEAIAAELARVRAEDPNAEPAWVSGLTGGINLQSAKLQGAILLFAKLQGAHLEDTCLQEADLRGAKLQEAILVNTKLQRAHLEYAELHEALLGEANLQGAHLNSATFHDAILGGANLRGADLSYSHFEKVDLFHAKSLEGAYFCNAFLDDTRMRREQVGEGVGEELEGKYDEAKEAYLALKNNFAEIGRYRDESWAYIKERQMGKMCHAPWRARRFYGASQLGDTEESKLPTWHPRVLWFYATHIRRWARDWIEELLCKYGESLGRVSGWMIANLLGFAAYYWHIGGVWIVEPNGEAKVARRFWHYLIYSIGAFTTTGFARFQAADDRVRMVTAIQAIIGIVLAGLLGFVTGNRIRRS